MSKWFVRAERGKTNLDMPVADQGESTIFGKQIAHKSARTVAYEIKENLIKQGWNRVRVVKVD